MLSRNTTQFLCNLTCLLLLFGAVGRSEAGLFGGRKPSVALGIDRLRADGYAALKGLRVGLITNHSGVDSSGVKTRLVLHRAPEVNLVALYTPEHGLDGTELAGKWVESRIDKATGLKAFSLYGKTRKPSRSMLEGIDILLFDIQDVGARCYTYVSTMGLCMEAAAEAGIPFVVLDRPNPLGGDRVEGPPIESKWISFVGQYPVPFVHGLTAGELAKMIVGEGWIKAKPQLTVVPLGGWKRSMGWDKTGLRWVRTSPNIPRAESCDFYIATGIAQHVPGIDAGTGTPTPFEYVAAKGVDGARLAAELKALKLAGVKFSAYRSRKKAGWEGVELDLEPSKVKSLAALDLILLEVLYRHSKKVGIDLIASAGASGRSLLFKVYGSDSLRRDLEAGRSGAQIAASWAGGNRKFRTRRAAYLIYR